MKAINLQNMRIRQVTQTELPQCLNIIHESFATVAMAFGITKENWPTHTSFLPLERLQKDFENGDVLFASFAEGEPVGYASLKRLDHICYELNHLSVLPSYRHHGIGRGLLQFAKEHVYSLGGEKIKIGIIEEHTVLKNWYLSHGFVHTGVHKFPQQPFTAGFMEWTAYFHQ